MAERTVPPAEVIGNGRTKIDFDDLKRFGDKITQYAVEFVRCLNLLKPESRKKLMPSSLKGETIAAEAIIVDVREKLRCGRRVGNDHPPRLQKRNLILV